MKLMVKKQLLRQNVIVRLKHWLLYHLLLYNFEAGFFKVIFSRIYMKKSNSSHWKINRFCNYQLCTQGWYLRNWFLFIFSFFFSSAYIKIQWALMLKFVRWSYFTYLFIQIWYQWPDLNLHICLSSCIPSVYRI